MESGDIGIKDPEDVIAALKLGASAIDLLDQYGDRISGLIAAALDLSVEVEERRGKESPPSSSVDLNDGERRFIEAMRDAFHQETPDFELDARIVRSATCEIQYKALLAIADALETFAPKFRTPSVDAPATIRNIIRIMREDAARVQRTGTVMQLIPVPDAPKGERPS